MLLTVLSLCASTSFSSEKHPGVTSELMANTIKERPESFNPSSYERLITAYTLNPNTIKNHQILEYTLRYITGGDKIDDLQVWLNAAKKKKDIHDALFRFVRLYCVGLCSVTPKEPVKQTLIEHFKKWELAPHVLYDLERFCTPHSLPQISVKDVEMLSLIHRLQPTSFSDDIELMFGKLKGTMIATNEGTLQRMLESLKYQLDSEDISPTKLIIASEGMKREGIKKILSARFLGANVDAGAVAIAPLLTSTNHALLDSFASQSLEILASSDTLKKATLTQNINSQLDDLIIGSKQLLTEQLNKVFSDDARTLAQHLNASGISYQHLSIVTHSIKFLEERGATPACTLPFANAEGKTVALGVAKICAPEDSKVGTGWFSTFTTVAIKAAEAARASGVLSSTQQDAVGSLSKFIQNNLQGLNNVLIKMLPPIIEFYSPMASEVLLTTQSPLWTPETLTGKEAYELLSAVVPEEVMNPYDWIKCWEALRNGILALTKNMEPAGTDLALQSERIMKRLAPVMTELESWVLANNNTERDAEVD